MMSALGGFPFGTQDGVEMDIFGRAACGTMLAEDAFAGHAQFFEEADRSEIVGKDRRAEAVELQFIEGVKGDMLRGFGHIAASPEVLMQGIADVGAGVVGIVVVKLAATDHFAARFFLQRPPHETARIEREPVQEIGAGLLFRGVRSPHTVAGDGGLLSIFEEIGKIAFAEWAQDEVRCCEVGNGHWWLVFSD